MSNRIQSLDPASVTGKGKELVDGIQKGLGKVPNIFRGMVNSPATLQAYLGFSGALKEGVLNAKLRERIALAVGQEGNCQYCLSAHSAIGKGAGLQDAEIEAARQGQAADAKEQAILKFALRVVKNRGNVSDAELAEVRSAGANDAEITETIANVALNLFTNYFNHVADTVVDFPEAKPLAARV